jgi:O-antigen/teichoic acid export membrane protein
MSKDLKKIEKELKTAGTQVGAIGAVRLIGLIAGFGINYALARFYGSSVLGAYAVVKTIIATASVVTVFGLGNTLINYIPELLDHEQNGDIRRLITKAITTTAVVSVFSACIIYFYKYPIDKHIFDKTNIINVLPLAGIILVFFSLEKVLRGLFRAYKKATLYNLVKISTQKIALLAFVIAGLVLSAKDVTFVVSSYGASVFLTVLLLLYAVKNLKIGLHPKHLFSKFTYLSKSSVTRYAGSMLSISIVSRMMNRSDILIMGLFLSSDKIGIYKVSLSLAVLMSFLHNATNSIFAPIISDLTSNKNIKTLQKVYSTVTKWVVTASIPMLISFMVFPSLVLSVFGQSYMKGNILLQALLVAEFSKVVVGANGYILNFSRYESLMVLNNTTVAILNVLLNFLLIPYIGVLGAAIASAVSLSILNFAKLAQVYYFLDIMPYTREYLPTFAMSILLLGLSILFRNKVSSIHEFLLLVLFCYGVAMTFMSFFLNGFEEEVYRTIKNKAYNLVRI